MTLRFLNEQGHDTNAIENEDEDEDENENHGEILTFLVVVNQVVVETMLFGSANKRLKEFSRCCWDDGRGGVRFAEVFLFFFRNPASREEARSLL
jgi:hypothetical protein